MILLVIACIINNITLSGFLGYFYSISINTCQSPHNFSLFNLL